MRHLKNRRNIGIILGVILLLTAIVTGAALFMEYRREHVFVDGTTVPEPKGQSFIVIGDSRDGDSIYQDIVASIVSSFSSSTCFINTGDMINTPGDLKQWKRFLEMTAPIASVMPWYGVIGNHDVKSLESQRIYQEVMDFPGNELYYSFDAINSHFIVLDTYIPGQAELVTGEQLAWLKQDLETYTSSAQYVFVFTHATLYPQGHYKGHNLINADELHQLFVRYGVDAVFSGHEHQYYLFQKDSVHYVVTAGGGAPLYKGGIGMKFHHYLLVELLPPHELRIHVLDIHGKVIRTDVVRSLVS